MKQSNHITTRTPLRVQQQRYSTKYHQQSLHIQRGGKNIIVLLFLLFLVTILLSDQHRPSRRLIQPSNALVGPHPYQILKHQSQLYTFGYFQSDRGYSKTLVGGHPNMAQRRLRHRFPNNKITLKDNKDNDDNDDEKDTLIDDNTKESHIFSGKNKSYTNIEKNIVGKRTKQLQHENDQLKQVIQRLETENHILHQKVAAITTGTTGTASNQQQGKQYQTLYPPPPPIVVLERFEGERNTFTSFHSSHTKSNKELDKNSNHQLNKNDIENGNHHSNETSVLEMWCDATTGTVNGDVCPVEPEIQFTEALRDRAVWLVSLLILQSISGIILLKNEIVLANHPSSK
jgi:hypothetical protein